MLPYVDLHVHSQHSDGTMTVCELLDQAVENEVGLLAVADHNVLTGSRELLALAPERGVRVLPAVELDTYCPENGHLHVLAYGINPDDQAFDDFVRRARKALDFMSDVLIAAMVNDGRPVSLDAYTSFEHQPAQGGWKALQYFLSIGLTQSLKEGVGLYNEYSVDYEEAGFATLKDTCDAIHAAGGYAVLAHPGEMLDTSDPKTFRHTLCRIVHNGLDGIECYYPSHTPEVTEQCLAVCGGLWLMITSGSDCHGSFGKTRVGEMRMPAEKLALGALGDMIQQSE